MRLKLRLNGWHRLWVVASLCYVIPMLALAIANAPRFDPPRYSPPASAEDKEEIRRIFGPPDPDYLNRSRREHWRKQVPRILAPPLALYAVGFGVVWIRRGFRQSPDLGR
jgi:hypothetical protein